MQAERQTAADTVALANGWVERFLEVRTEESFNGVCHWLAPQLMRYFRIRGCEHTAAEELTQDVLFTVFRQADTIRDRSLFRGWVYKVARNALLQRVRKAQRSVEVTALESLGPNRREASVAPAVDSEFAALVAILVPEEREILTLRFVEGFDYREIAAALDIPVGTAKWRVFNSKLKLSMHMRTIAK